MDQSNSIQLPVPAGTILHSIEEIEQIKPGSIPDQSLGQEDASLYRSITGSLLYLANGTRFDILYATS